MAEDVIAGRYRLGRRLGAGGTAEVWAATDLELDRQVAVKILAPQADAARFQREARAAAALAHPNVCSVYSYGETRGRPFIVLEYLPGGSLERRLAASRPLPDEETARIAREVAAGLAHAHRRGLVHRDLTPTNVLFDASGRAKITDFGLARIADETALTDAGTVLGTAAYISPEQAAGEPATTASDVYAFGVILFRMLTGRLPFEAGDALALAAMHRDLPAPAVASLRPDAPPRLESVAAAALAKSPRDRPQDGSALLAELAGALRPAPTGDATAVLRTPPRKRRKAFLAVVAALVAVAGAALALAVTLGDRETGGTSSSAPSAPPPAPALLPPAPPPAEPETATERPTDPLTGATSPATSSASAPTTAPTETRRSTRPAPPTSGGPAATSLPPPPFVPTSPSPPATTAPTTTSLPVPPTRPTTAPAPTTTAPAPTTTAAPTTATAAPPATATTAPPG